jgi:hypothetical protein
MLKHKFVHKVQKLNTYPNIFPDTVTLRIAILPKYVRHKDCV